TVPGGIVGLLFDKQIETTWRNPLIIAASLIVVGVFMGWADRAPAQSKDFDQTSTSQAWWIGCAQAVAVIPGVSRSGATITAGLFAGLTREAAARFSFLLATPIIAGAVLDKAHEVHKTGIPAAMRAPFAVGIVVSALVGMASIALFIRFLKVKTLRFFVWYRILLGLAVLALFFAGFRSF
ncbi:MAG: undecaprenyl-diphosphate phosphatase, partial [Stellaceae bacterium]